MAARLLAAEHRLARFEARVQHAAHVVRRFAAGPRPR